MSILDSDQQEVCIKAAIQMDDGSVLVGRRHADIMAEVWITRPDYRFTQLSQGFLTNKGRFVSRSYGSYLQREAGIFSADTGRQVGSRLLSEDLY